MRDLAIVTIGTINLENYTPAAGQDDYPQSPGSAIMTSPPFISGDHFQSQPSEMKVFEMQTTDRCQERQLERLQNDQYKRIQEYRELRQKLETDTNGMQKQIDGIQKELQKMHKKTMEVEEMRGRVVRCEEQNVQMQIHNDSEFQILRSVMKNVCGRIDRMEELQLVERDFQMQTNVHHQQYQQEQLQTHQILLQQQQEQEHGQQHIIMEDSHHAAHAPAPAPLIQPEAPNPYSFRGLTPRAPCPKCHKELSKIYIKTHLKYKRCQI